LDARNKIDKGLSRLALIIPEDFTLDLDRGTGATVGLFIDGQDANSSNVAAGYAQSIIMGWELKYCGKNWRLWAYASKTLFRKRAPGYTVQPDA